VNDRSLAQVYGSAAPEIVRTEPTEERILVAVAEGMGITLLVDERAVTLRYPGVFFGIFLILSRPLSLGSRSVSRRRWRLVASSILLKKLCASPARDHLTCSS
jgi:hypothetical protein